MANSRPTDPVAFLANYLHGFSKHKDIVLQNPNNVTTVYNVGIAPPPQPDDDEISPLANAERAAEMLATLQVVDDIDGSNAVVADPVFSNDDTPELAQSSDDRVTEMWKFSSNYW